MAELGPVGGIEEGARPLAGPRREEITVEGHDDEEKGVLGGGGGVADQDVRSLAQPELVPAEVVKQDAAQGEEPDAEGDHGRPEEERDEAHEECRVERRQDDDGESAEGGAQAEDLQVHVAQGAGKPFIAGVLSAEADPLIGRPQHEGAHREGAKNDVDEEEDADGPAIGDERQLNTRLSDEIGAGQDGRDRHGDAQSDSSTRRPRRPASPAAPTRKPKPPSSIAQSSRLGWPPSAPTSDSCK